MESIVISGGAGFIGSHLVEALLARGYRIAIIDNLITGTLRNLAHLDVGDRLTVYQQDCAVPVALPWTARYVLHFASPASPIDYLRHPLETLCVGSYGTHAMLELAREHRARFLLASTSEVYGDPLVHPQTEGYYGNVNPIGPRSVYDEAKRYAETLTMAYHRTHAVNTGIVRIFNTYGPRMRLRDGRAIPNFLLQALTGEPLTIYGDGTMTRSFCYVRDLVEGLIRLMQTEYHDPVNLGNPREYTVLELAHRILAATGAQSPLVYQPAMADDPKLRRPDISRAVELIGWQPTVELDEGLALTIPAFRQALADEGVLPPAS